MKTSKITRKDILKWFKKASPIDRNMIIGYLTNKYWDEDPSVMLKINVSKLSDWDYVAEFYEDFGYSIAKQVVDYNMPENVGEAYYNLNNAIADIYEALTGEEFSL